MSTETNPEPSKDKYFYYLIYALFYALGVVTVVPTNFVTTATDYWLYKFRDIGSNETYSSQNKTALQAEFTSDYSVVSNVGYLAFIVLTIRAIRTRFNLFQRTFGTLSGAILIFILICSFVRADTDSWQRGFFVFSLVIGFFLTGICGVFMVTLYEMVNKFPGNYVPTIFSGQAICGIFAALAQILALGIGGTPQTTGLVYFLIGMFFIFLSFMGFLAAYWKLEFFRYHLLKEAEARRQIKISKELILSALNKAKFYMLSMVLVLGSTVILQPGVITLVDSVDKGNGNPWNDKFFGPTINFLFFHLFDYIGREAAIFLNKPTNGLILLGLSCCRIAFIPLIIFCNAQPRNHLPVVFDADYAYIIFLIVFAVSNGYLINMAIVTVPTVTNEDERPFAMLGVLLLMVLSLAIGASTSTAVVKAL